MDTSRFLERILESLASKAGFDSQLTQKLIRGIPDQLMNQDFGVNQEKKAEIIQFTQTVEWPYELTQFTLKLSSIISTKERNRRFIPHKDEDRRKHEQTLDSLDQKIAQIFQALVKMVIKISGSNEDRSLIVLIFVKEILRYNLTLDEEITLKEFERYWVFLGGIAAGILAGLAIAFSAEIAGLLGVEVVEGGIIASIAATPAGWIIGIAAAVAIAIGGTIYVCQKYSEGKQLSSAINKLNKFYDSIEN